jgi:hypothetical protein
MALHIFSSIIFLDLNNGPIKATILLEILDASFKPNILNMKKKNIMIIN